MAKYVERFNVKERILHWFVAVSFFTLVFSGLGLYARLFHGYFNLFGGGEYGASTLLPNLSMKHFNWPGMPIW